MRFVALLLCSRVCFSGTEFAQKVDLDPLKLLVVQAEQAPPPEAAKLREQVTRQMLELSPAQLRSLLGHPKTVARQVLYRRYLEQWVYDRPAGLCLVFHCTKGQEPRLQRVRWLHEETP
jgi:hypothetical protein